MLDISNCTASSSCGGWVGAIISCVSMGSFATPIKSQGVMSVNVDPLVFHTYKVILCFVTSLAVLLPPPFGLGEEFYVTPWGIISNIFWVPASIASVYAVKHAGLAVSQGVSCTCIVLISFVWGIFIFDEQVKSRPNAIFALLLIVIGLWGMALYSSPEGKDDADADANSDSDSDAAATAANWNNVKLKQVSTDSLNSASATSTSSSSSSSGVSDAETHSHSRKSNGSGNGNGDDIGNSSLIPLLPPHSSKRDEEQQQSKSFVGGPSNINNNLNTLSSSSSSYGSIAPPINTTAKRKYANNENAVGYDYDDYDYEYDYHPMIAGHNNNNNYNGNDYESNAICGDGGHPYQTTSASASASVVTHHDHDHDHGDGQKGRLQLSLSPRTRGLIASVFNGLWGGSIFVPMHYAPPQAHGTGYAISFAIGAVIVTAMAWIIRWGMNVVILHFHLHLVIPRSDEKEDDTDMDADGLMGFHDHDHAHTKADANANANFRNHALDAYHSLPSFHVRTLWIPGSIYGILWNVGNISSMVSVQTLGQGVGYSVTQANMLVGGMWGIFYFREVTRLDTRLKWFAAALITIVGILLLSHEHE